MEKIDYKQSKFLTSAAKLSQLPELRLGEIAFAGRSNAGKSSVLNRLTKQKALAKVSKQPGRTQLINFFTLEDDWYLVDLPGYGFAKVPISVKKRWEETLAQYLAKRETLKGIVLIMDCRHPLKTVDEQMIQWAIHYNIHIHLVLNKMDKLSRSAALSTLAKVKKQTKHELVSAQLFSALKWQGLEELENQVQTLLMKK